MKQELKTKWVKALRSGKYKQGQWALRRTGSDDLQDAMCCIGVLLDVMDPTQWRITETDNRICMHGSSKLIGSLDQSMLTEIGMSIAQQDHLISMNDKHQSTFAQIADWIQDNIEEGEKE
jgi:hypothetical protein